MNRCTKCGKYNYSDEPCNCKPFEVYYEEYYGDELKTIYGFYHEDIVRKVAMILNEDDPEFEEPIFETPVKITDESGITKTFNCTANVCIHYSVREIEE